MSYGLQLRTTTGMQEVGAVRTMIFMGRVNANNQSRSAPVWSGWWEDGGFFDLISADNGAINSARVSGGSIIWDTTLAGNVNVSIDFWLVGSLV